MKQFKKILLLTITVSFFLPIIIISADPSPTFPEDYAGITAYAKTEDINEENNIDKLTKAVAIFKNIEGGEVIENKPTHVIGKIPVEFTVFNNDTEEENHYLFTISPYIYIDANGWIASYLNKDKPTSKIIDWNRYSKGEFPPNILEKLLETISNKLNFTYSEPNYYHFQYPEASQITIIIDTVYTPDEIRENSFSVSIPGDVHEASYSIFYTNSVLSHQRCLVELKVDNIKIDKEKTSNLRCRKDNYIYNLYPEDTFVKNNPHLVSFDGLGGIFGTTEIRLGAGTVLLYEKN